ncbi:MAG: hypothetical protein K2N87_15920 [Eubacterium sp.]|nr:hypothetical protein [Eubacterium sp.]
MGEIIKTIENIQIGNTKLKIELNHSTTGHEKYEIHIQNDKFRLALPEKDFLQMASCFVLAKKQMDLLKRRGGLEGLKTERAESTGEKE